MQTAAIQVSLSELGRIRPSEIHNEIGAERNLNYSLQNEINAQIQFLLGQLQDAKIAAQGDITFLSELDESYRELESIKPRNFSFARLSAIAQHIHHTKNEIALHNADKAAKAEKLLSGASKHAILSHYATTNFLQSAYVTQGKITNLFGFAKQFGFLDQLPLMERLNNMFAEDEVLVNNPDIHALSAMLAKIDAPVEAAQLKARHVVDAAANTITGVLRNFADMSTQIQNKMLLQLEKFQGASSLSTEDKEAMMTLARVLRESGVQHLSNVLQAAKEGRTFNNMASIKQYLVIDKEKMEAKLVTVWEISTSDVPCRIPDDTLNPILKEALAAGAQAKRAVSRSAPNFILPFDSAHYKSSVLNSL